MTVCMKNYIDHLKIHKRNEVLDNAGDTIKHTTIPTQKEILNDLNSQEDVDECWGVTDNYGMKIFLEYGIHFI